MENTRHFMELLWAMTEKELRARYKNTLFGFFWMFVNPLLQMFVIGLIFRFFVSNTPQNYFLYLLSGLLVWNFFSLSLNKATPSIVNERALVKKASFPKSTVPLSIIFSNFINLFSSFALIVLYMIIGGGIPPLWFVYFTTGFVLLLFFTTGITLITSSLNVKYRDVSFFVQAALIVWFYATPIIYVLDSIPKMYRYLWGLNPLTAIVQLFQSGTVGSQAPSAEILASNIVISLLTLLVGLVLFKKEGRYFDDWI